MPLPIANAADILTTSLHLLAISLGPFVVFAVVIHLLEKTIQRTLAERFGWKSVMWTGWLGTPIHELSHVVMCYLFNHRVQEVALFEPDRASGRLGYVRHTWIKGNWFQELGNVFIAIAPLMGGSIALCLLLWLFFPEVIETAFVPAGLETQSTVTDRVISVFSQIADPANLLSIKFWVFVYLVLCVSSHMAPSRSDYQGAGKGSVLFTGLALLLSGLIAATVADPIEFQLSMAQLLSPLFGVLAIATFLCVIATLVVALLASRFPKRYVIR